jgi:hypothetical protein
VARGAKAGPRGQAVLQALVAAVERAARLGGVKKRWGLALAVVGLFGFEDFEIDEMECEHAIAHLEECCDDTFAVSEEACNGFSGCGTTQKPILGEQQSECVQERTCDEIARDKLCEKVPLLLNPTETEGGGSPDVREQQVCP